MTTLAQNRTEHDPSDAPLASDRPLTAFDRCDSCGAQAYVRVVLNGSELLFCGHHAKKHESKLRAIAEVWHDETERLASSAAR